MEINCHFAFHLSNRELIDVLQTNGVAYKASGNFGSVDILDSHPAWSVIDNYLRNTNHINHKQSIFSQTELQSAKWLRMRSCWHNGYPQPESSYRTLTYDCAHYCNQCGSGSIQAGAFRILKAPNWGNRSFFMLNWVPDELFVNNNAKNILQRADLTGFSFMEVHNKKGTEKIDGTYQLIIPTILPTGLIPELPAVDDVYFCNQCRTNKYHPSGIGSKRFHKEIFDDAPDIVKTAEMFGWGHSASRLILVSQKMYRNIIDNHLDRSLCFEPIDLI